ncbi:uncharacterized protein LOC117108754 [Anneissia japonica]|uniref:uncharacterized protein LOC117108754 n=1 Tax=Anneissia japonica TaxID=1529436 RepID=UPI001425A744|nr:uncharacterized protein LOC117108754 [Anneissia japonica]
MRGRKKQITPAVNSNVEPSPNFECHVSREPSKVGGKLNRLISYNQIFVYEYDEECLPSKHPRHCHPYAVVTCASRTQISSVKPDISKAALMTKSRKKATESVETLKENRKTIIDSSEFIVLDEYVSETSANEASSDDEQLQPTIICHSEQKEKAIRLKEKITKLTNTVKSLRNSKTNSRHNRKDNKDYVPQVVKKKICVKKEANEDNLKFKRNKGRAYKCKLIRNRAHWRRRRKYKFKSISSTNSLRNVEANKRVGDFGLAAEYSAACKIKESTEDKGSKWQSMVSDETLVECDVNNDALKCCASEHTIQNVSLEKADEKITNILDTSISKSNPQVFEYNHSQINSIDYKHGRIGFSSIYNCNEPCVNSWNLPLETDAMHTKISYPVDSSTQPLSSTCSNSFYPTDSNLELMDMDISSPEPKVFPHNNVDTLCISEDELSFSDTAKWHEICDKLKNPISVYQDKNGRLHVQYSPKEEQVQQSSTSSKFISGEQENTSDKSEVEISSFIEKGNNLQSQKCFSKDLKRKRKHSKEFHGNKLLIEHSNPRKILIETPDGCEKPRDPRKMPKDPRKRTSAKKESIFSVLNWSEKYSSPASMQTSKIDQSKLSAYNENDTVSNTKESPTLTEQCLTVQGNSLLKKKHNFVPKYKPPTFLSEMKFESELNKQFPKKVLKQPQNQSIIGLPRKTIEDRLSLDEKNPKKKDDNQLKMSMNFSRGKLTHSSNPVTIEGLDKPVADKVSPKHFENKACHIPQESKISELSEKKETSLLPISNNEKNKKHLLKGSILLPLNKDGISSCRKNSDVPHTQTSKVTSLKQVTTKSSKDTEQVPIKKVSEIAKGTKKNLQLNIKKTKETNSNMQVKKSLVSPEKIEFSHSSTNVDCQQLLTNSTSSDPLKPLVKTPQKSYTGNKKVHEVSKITENELSTNGLKENDHHLSRKSPLQSVLSDKATTSLDTLKEYLHEPKSKISSDSSNCTSWTSFEKPSKVNQAFVLVRFTRKWMTKCGWGTKKMKLDSENYHLRVNWIRVLRWIELMAVRYRENGMYCFNLGIVDVRVLRHYLQMQDQSCKDAEFAIHDFDGDELENLMTNLLLVYKAEDMPKDLIEMVCQLQLDNRKIKVEGSGEKFTAVNRKLKKISQKKSQNQHKEDNSASSKDSGEGSSCYNSGEDNHQRDSLKRSNEVDGKCKKDRKTKRKKSISSTPTTCNNDHNDAFISKHQLLEILAHLENGKGSRKKITVNVYNICSDCGVKKNQHIEIETESDDSSDTPVSDPESIEMHIAEKLSLSNEVESQKVSKENHEICKKPEVTDFDSMEINMTDQSSDSNNIEEKEVNKNGMHEMKSPERDLEFMQTNKTEKLSYEVENPEFKKKIQKMCIKTPFADLESMELNIAEQSLHNNEVEDQEVNMEILEMYREPPNASLNMVTNMTEESCSQVVTQEIKKGNNEITCNKTQTKNLESMEMNMTEQSPNSNECEGQEVKVVILRMSEEPPDASMVINMTEKSSCIDESLEAETPPVTNLKSKEMNMTEKLSHQNKEECREVMKGIHEIYKEPPATDLDLMQINTTNILSHSNEVEIMDGEKGIHEPPAADLELMDMNMTEKLSHGKRVESIVAKKSIHENSSANEDENCHHSKSLTSQSVTNAHQMLMVTNKISSSSTNNPTLSDHQHIEERQITNVSENLMEEDCMQKSAFKPSQEPESSVTTKDPNSDSSCRPYYRSEATVRATEQIENQPEHEKTNKHSWDTNTISKADVRSNKDSCTRHITSLNIEQSEIRHNVNLQHHDKRPCPWKRLPEDLPALNSRSENNFHKKQSNIETIAHARRPHTCSKDMQRPLEANLQGNKTDLRYRLQKSQKRRCFDVTLKSPVKKHKHYRNPERRPEVNVKMKSSIQVVDTSHRRMKDSEYRNGLHTKRPVAELCDPRMDKPVNYRDSSGGSRKDYNHKRASFESSTAARPYGDYRYEDHNPDADWYQLSSRNAMWDDRDYPNHDYASFIAECKSQDLQHIQSRGNQGKHQELYNLYPDSTL